MQTAPAFQKIRRSKSKVPKKMPRSMNWKMEGSPGERAARRDHFLKQWHERHFEL